MNASTSRFLKFADADKAKALAAYKHYKALMSSSNALDALNASTFLSSAKAHLRSRQFYLIMAYLRY